jgi:hypothetical protein
MAGRKSKWRWWFCHTCALIEFHFTQIWIVNTTYTTALLEDIPLGNREHVVLNHHDRPPQHYRHDVYNLIENNFHGWWIGQEGPTHCLPWFRDLNTVNFFLWKHSMENVYLIPHPSYQRTQQAFCMLPRVLIMMGLDYVSELRPSTGLLFIPRVMCEHGVPWWWWCWLGITSDSSTRAFWQSYQQRHLGQIGGMDEGVRILPISRPPWNISRDL